MAKGAGGGAVLLGACATCAAQGINWEEVENVAQRMAQLEVVAEQEGQDKTAGALRHEAAESRGRARMQQLIADIADADEEGAGAGPAGALADEEEDEGTAEQEDNEGHHRGLGFDPAER